MNYSTNYNDIFNFCRPLLVRQVCIYLDTIQSCITNNRRVSLELICMVADLVTAYNELCHLGFFMKTEYFKPNN